MKPGYSFYLFVLLLYRALYVTSFLQMVRQVFEDSRNALRTAVSVAKGPSGLFKDQQLFIFLFTSEIWSIALWVECNGRTWEAQTAVIPNSAVISFSSCFILRLGAGGLRWSVCVGAIFLLLSSDQKYLEKALLPWNNSAVITGKCFAFCFIFFACEVTKPRMLIVITDLQKRSCYGEIRRSNFVIFETMGNRPVYFFTHFPRSVPLPSVWTNEKEVEAFHLSERSKNTSLSLCWELRWSRWDSKNRCFSITR